MFAFACRFDFNVYLFAGRSPAQDMFLWAPGTGLPMFRVSDMSWGKT